jgi:hypothetical protein
MTPVTKDQLEALAATVPINPPAAPTNGGGRPSFDIAAWIAKYMPDAEGPNPWQRGQKWVMHTCPWDATHTNRAAYIVQHASGAISAGCHHNGCADKDWHALRDLLEPGWRKPGRKATVKNQPVDAPGSGAATAPVVEFLDNAPAALSRPIDLVEGHAYAAAWIWTRTTVTESVSKSGVVQQHNPPIVEQRRELFVIRDDGVAFGPAMDKSLDELGLDIALPTPLRDTKMWRASAVAAYRSGRRPDPRDVFARIAGVYDQFIDFRTSLAGQPEMCELSACASLMTWFARAFTVLGYLWPNGEAGAGKTQWGHCWAETSYLGEVITMGGTFAALRDLADYGASLLFDDAENLSDPKRVDPDKRALLLAGNRRGASIPLKEPGPDRTWQLRWVNAFCPRAFTAISPPDYVLASRSIVIPLLRTDDPKRGNADPANPASWPCDQRSLQDDLWATALWLLPEAGRIWTELDRETDAVGRDFEPWRAVLAVARLFERHGVGGLEARMRGVMEAYRAERVDILGDNHVNMVLLALMAMVKEATPADSKDSKDSSDSSTGGVAFSASQIADRVRKDAEEEGGQAEWATPERVGRTLRKLRFKQERAPDKKRTREWVIPPAQLERLARAYRLAPPQSGDQESDPPMQVSEPVEPSELSEGVAESARVPLAKIDRLSLEIPFAHVQEIIRSRGVDYAEAKQIATEEAALAVDGGGAGEQSQDVAIDQEAADQNQVTLGPEPQPEPQPAQRANAQSRSNDGCVVCGDPPVHLDQGQPICGRCMSARRDAIRDHEREGHAGQKVEWIPVRGTLACRPCAMRLLVVVAEEAAPSATRPAAPAKRAG